MSRPKTKIDKLATINGNIRNNINDKLQKEDSFVTSMIIKKNNNEHILQINTKDGIVNAPIVIDNAGFNAVYSVINNLPLGYKIRKSLIEAGIPNIKFNEEDNKLIEEDKRKKEEEDKRKKEEEDKRKKIEEEDEKKKIEEDEKKKIEDKQKLNIKRKKEEDKQKLNIKRKKEEKEDKKDVKNIVKDIVEDIVKKTVNVSNTSKKLKEEREQEINKPENKKTVKLISNKNDKFLSKLKEEREQEINTPENKKTVKLIPNENDKFLSKLKEEREQELSELRGTKRTIQTITDEIVSKIGKKEKRLLSKSESNITEISKLIPDKSEIRQKLEQKMAFSVPKKITNEAKEIIEYVKPKTDLAVIPAIESNNSLVKVSKIDASGNDLLYYVSIFDKLYGMVDNVLVTKNLNNMLVKFSNNEKVNVQEEMKNILTQISEKYENDKMRIIRNMKFNEGLNDKLKKIKFKK
jgi:hypothetical protein